MTPEYDNFTMDWSNATGTMEEESNRSRQFHLSKRRKVVRSSSIKIPSASSHHEPSSSSSSSKVCDLSFPHSMLPPTTECVGDSRDHGNSTACHQSQTPDTFMHSGHSCCMSSSYCTTASMMSSSCNSEIGLPDFITSIPPIPNLSGLGMEDSTGRGNSRRPFSISRRSSTTSWHLK